MIEPQQMVADSDVDRFLCLCLRGRWDPTALQRARALASRGTVEWEALGRVAEVESLAPLLYAVVRDQDLVPPPLEEVLHQAYVRSAVRNAFLLRSLNESLRHLSQEGVDVVLLKGAALVHTVYRRAAARPMRDFDLLVRQGDIPAVLRVLIALGYTRVKVETHPGVGVAYENEVLLCKPGFLDVFVEAHWSLFDSPYYQQKLPVEWFWQTASAIRPDEAPARVLGPEAQILHLCGHLVLHHSQEEKPRLLWLHDMAEVITFYQDRIDWQQVLRQAQACDLVLPLQQVLPQVAKEWGAPIPESILEALCALQPTRSEVRVFAWLTAKHRPVAQRFWADLASMQDWRQRLRYAWLNVFPSPAYMRHRYHIPHPLLTPLYYPYRWLLGLRSAL